MKRNWAVIAVLVMCGCGGKPRNVAHLSEDHPDLSDKFVDDPTCGPLVAQEASGLVHKHRVERLMIQAGNKNRRIVEVRLPETVPLRPGQIFSLPSPDGLAFDIDRIKVAACAKDHVTASAWPRP